MSKQEILDYFNDINHAYNEAGRLDSLSYMIDELLEDIKAEIEAEKNAGCHTWYAGGLDFAISIINKHIGKGQG